MDTCFLLLLSGHFYTCYSFASYEATLHPSLRQIVRKERSIIRKACTECYDIDEIVGFILFPFLQSPCSHFYCFMYSAVIVMDQYTQSGFHYHFSQNAFKIRLEPV